MEGVRDWREVRQRCAPSVKIKKVQRNETDKGTD